MDAERMKICTISEDGGNCGRGTYARGWCWKHYLRWRRHGDPTILRKVGKPRLRGGPTELAEELGVSRQRAYQILQPEKHHARQMVLQAVQAGKLVRPDRCSRCGGLDKRIEGHHSDYAKPLEVQWLCSPCHAVAHRHILGSRRGEPYPEVAVA